MIRYIAPRSLGRRTLVLAIIACLCLLGAALPAAPASADAGTKIVERCAHGQSLAGFTVKQYQATLESLTTEEIEYHSECVEAIQQAELAAASSHKGAIGSGGTSGGRGPGGGSPGEGQGGEPTPTEERTLQATRRDGAPAVRVGGDAKGSTSPGVVRPDLASAASELPTAVLVVIAAVIGGILLLAGHEIRERMQRPRHS